MPSFDLLRTSQSQPAIAPAPLAGLWIISVVVSLLLAAGCGGEQQPANPTATPLPAHPRVLVFGDSYTEGVGAIPATRGYAYQLGEQLGWDVTVDGVGGTGYVAPGPLRTGAFVERLATTAPGPFDLIILQGSSNDEREPLAELAPAVDQTVLAFRAKYPAARIVLLGLIALDGAAPEVKAAVNDTLKNYADSHQLSFIDPIAESWFAEGESRTMANPTNGHPSNNGYLRIRDRLVIDLSRLTAVPAPE